MSGYISDCAHDTYRSPLLIVDALAARCKPVDTPVGPENAIFLTVSDFFSKTFLNSLVNALAIIRVQKRDKKLIADNRVCLQAKNAFALIAPNHSIEHKVTVPQTDAGGLHSKLIMGLPKGRDLILLDHTHTFS